MFYRSNNNILSMRVYTGKYDIHHIDASDQVNTNRKLQKKKQRRRTQLVFCVSIFAAPITPLLFAFAFPIFFMNKVVYYEKSKKTQTLSIGKIFLLHLQSRKTAQLRFLFCCSYRRCARFFRIKIEEIKL